MKLVTLPRCSQFYILLMRFSGFKKAIFQSGFLLALSVPTMFGYAAPAEGETSQSADLAVITGIVRGDSGPIADATVAIFRLGTSKLLKQVQSASDGSYVAKVFPGTYTILAVAQGYNPETLAQVEVSGSEALTFGFKLERAGSGNTLPEKRLDRNNPKWIIRSAQTSRSIYQNSEDDKPAVIENRDSDAADEAAEEPAVVRKPRGVVESYFASSRTGNFTGVNFAALIPLSADTEVVFTGQGGTGDAPLRFESKLKFRPAASHKVVLGGAVARLGNIAFEGRRKTLGQVSLQATDEWSVRPGVILLLGVDYARFVGAGSDYSVSPRIGLQFDIDSKTRLRSSFAKPAEARTWSQAMDLEDSQVMFREPVAIEDLIVENGAPKMNRSNRLEFGIERVLDNRSSIEANFFLDTTLARGIGISNLPMDSLGSGVSDFVGNQQGSAQGLRVVYSRRFNGRFSAAAGYAFGRGQSISADGISTPAALFENDLIQSAFGQFEADLKTGTNVKTIFRLSPAATVFAIDPFQGRLAIFDPGLSVLVTQNLPTLGLPFQAEAVVDARNLFDFQSGVTGEAGALTVNSRRRMLRGSILVRF